MEEKRTYEVTIKVVLDGIDSKDEAESIINNIFGEYDGYIHCYTYDTIGDPEITNIKAIEDGRECLRHKFSALLADTDEEHPKSCNVTLDAEAQGLSEAEKARVTSCFQFEDGTIWFNVNTMDEPIDFDDMETEDLRKIYNEMEYYLYL